MELNKFWINLLVIKSRAGTYLGALSFAMLLKVFWETFDNKILAIGLLITGICCLIILVYFDYKHIFEDESGMYFEKNSEWKKMKEQLNRIEQKVNK